MAGRKQIKKNRIEMASKLESDSFWNKLFIAIGEEGLSLSEFCLMENVHYNQVSWRLKSDADLQQQYAHVRQMRAMKNADKIEALALKCEQELIKPDSARVAIDARKWIASRLDPMQFGDKIQSTVTVLDMNKTYLNELKQLMKAGHDLKVIKHVD